MEEIINKYKDVNGFVIDILKLYQDISNNFSKKDICKKNSVRVKMLNPKIYCFLNQTINDYIIE